MFKRWLFKILKKSPADMPMVSYWKTKEAISAKVTKGKNGEAIMHMEGEKHPFPGYPRGYLLFGKLSKLKHEIKNQIFNESWAMLEQGKSSEEVAAYIKSILPNILEVANEVKYDMVPPERMVMPIRELHRAWTKCAKGETSFKVRDFVTFIFQEDDSYRFRFQWMSPFLKDIETAFAKLEHAEVINDMKERVRLWKRIFLTLMKDKDFREMFEAISKEIDWKKLELSEGDKYHFRGKYFKVDMDLFEY